MKAYAIVQALAIARAIARATTGIVVTLTNSKRTAVYMAEHDCKVVGQN